MEFAEPDYRVSVNAMPNDALLNVQYHHALIGSPQAWKSATGEGEVKVGAQGAASGVEWRGMWSIVLAVQRSVMWACPAATAEQSRAELSVHPSSSVPHRPSPMLPQVCHLDSGVRLDHPDLQGHIVGGWNLVPEIQASFNFTF